MDVEWPTFGTTMQILHKDKLKPLGYEQHTYEIMGTTKKIVRKIF